MSKNHGQDIKSVTRMQHAFTVAANPLNAVKFELGVVLALGVLVWLLHGWFASGVALQFVVLAGYGLIGMLWVVLRARRILRNVSASAGIVNQIERQPGPESHRKELRHG